jgi:phosphoribosylformylglycinamidine synthase
MEDQKLFDAVYAVGMEFCPALGMTIPVGKDSMSMKTKWGDEKVVSPLSLVVSGFAPVSDVRRTLTPELKDVPSVLILIDLGEGKNRLGGSCLAQVYGQVGDECPDAPEPALLRTFFREVQALNRAGKILAYHDRSDGGVFVTMAEMAFAGQCALEIVFDEGWRGQSDEDRLRLLFNEELGAVVQVKTEDAAWVRETLISAGLNAYDVAAVVKGNLIAVSEKGDDIYAESRVKLQQTWAETSFHVQSLRDNPVCAVEEFSLIADAGRPGLFVDVPWDLSGASKQIPCGDDNQKGKGDAPFVHSARPRVAVLREQGVNGQVEMAAAFDRAGFAAVDVHMSDLLAGRARLENFTGLAACGGFSYGDVLGAGSGWAKTILFNERMKEMFSEFFHRQDTFSLGVCNGCQMLAQLREIVPGAAAWPLFERNTSARFEARVCMVEIEASPSLFFDGMAGAKMPIVVAHGEGHVESVDAEALVGLRYIDTYGKVTGTYPLNPSGSVEGVAGLTSADGRALIVMPHPERVFLGVQHTWTRELRDSPWMRMFDNARNWVG